MCTLIERRSGGSAGGSAAKARCITLNATAPPAGGGRGDLVHVLTQGVESLDEYLTQFLPARALAARRETIVEMDRQIVEFYHASPGRFVRAVACEYLARMVSAFEYYFIFLALGLSAGYQEALLVSGLQSLAHNMTFFVPFEVGSKEAITYLLFARLGLDPGLGVFAAIVTRLRDMLWIGFGLLLVWVAGRPRPAAAGSVP